MNSPHAASSIPTAVRYQVLAFVCILSMITYLDRVCFGSAAPHIAKSLGLQSVDDLGWAFTAFSLAYALFEIPTGWLGDAFGPRKTLIRIVLCWSFFTLLTGLVGWKVAGITLGGVTVLVVIRLLFGMGEAGAYPNITRALHNWFPLAQRGMAQGFVWMSGRLMGGLTPLVWVFLVEQGRLDWRQAFGLFAILGVIWCVAFGMWFRNRPEEKETVNQAELELIRRDTQEEVHAAHHVPWGKLVRDGNLWALCFMYFCMSYGWYFNITYLPTFLDQAYSVDPKSEIVGLYKGGPLLLGALGCLLGGLLTDRYVRITGNRKWGRRVFGIAGHTLCGACYLVCIQMPSAALFALTISMAAFFNDLAMGSAWATCQDIGRRYAAIVAGCMNTIGNLGGATALFFTKRILNDSKEAHAASLGVPVEELTKEQLVAGLMPGYELNFLIYGLVYFMAVVLWFRITASRPVAQE